MSLYCEPEMSGSADVSGLEAAWARFRAERAVELESWLEAERLLTAGQRAGTSPAGRGDQLLAAEATLQRAIVDFAASENGGGDPTPLALALLRRAEALLDPGGAG